MNILQHTMHIYVMTCNVRVHKYVTTCNAYICYDVRYENTYILRWCLVWKALICYDMGIEVYEFIIFPTYAYKYFELFQRKILSFYSAYAMF